MQMSRYHTLFLTRAGTRMELELELERDCIVQCVSLFVEIWKWYTKQDKEVCINSILEWTIGIFVSAGTTCWLLLIGSSTLDRLLLFYYRLSNVNLNSYFSLMEILSFKLGKTI